MAVVFGVPLLVPLGMVPNGQMWGSGGRARDSIFQVSLGMCKPKSSPKSHVKQGGEGVLGCSQLWVEEARKEEQLARAGSADVDAPLWRCICGSLRAVPQQLTEQTPGGPLKVAEKFQTADFTGRALAASPPEAAFLSGHRHLLGQADFPISQAGVPCSLWKNKYYLGFFHSLWASEVQSNEVTVAWLMSFQNESPTSVIIVFVD